MSATFVFFCFFLPFHIQENDPVTNICQAADKQLFTLVEWAKRIPHFSELALDDQVILLRAGKRSSHMRTCRTRFIYFYIIYLLLLFTKAIL